MRYASLSGRLVLVGRDGRTALDVEEGSDGRLPSNPHAIYDDWEKFQTWAVSASVELAKPFERELLRAPVPSPRQLFAVGLNYGSHASEVGLDPNQIPPIFTKFVSSITGPYAPVPHPGGSVDWEAELVVVMAREARRVPVDAAWSYVAGLTVGQDISERELQHVGTMPQFSLGKSHPGFAPMGPWVVTLDEVPDPDDLELACWVNGEQVQRARTSEMIMSVPELVARLSRVVTLLPGDVIFTGTPAGVGLGRNPPRYLAVGDELTTRISGLGELQTTITAGDG